MNITICNMPPSDAGSTEIGWALLPEYWGRGYASALTDGIGVVYKYSPPEL